jgi:cbb3-type cytochrome oxidase subunit 3
VTVVSFALFIVLMIWVYRGHRKAAFDEAANVPFAADDEFPGDKTNSQ